MVDITQLRAVISGFDAGILQLEKNAFVPGPPAQGPAAGGPPPGDPAAMPPPGDPNAMPPQDPNMAPPPGDPNAMPPQGPPPPGDPAAGAPPAGGPMPPELEQVLSQLGGGMQEVAQTVEQQQATVEQLGSRQLELENKLQEILSSLKGPAPFEGSSKAPEDVEAAAGLPEEGAPA